MPTALTKFRMMNSDFRILINKLIPNSEIWILHYNKSGSIVGS